MTKRQATKAIEAAIDRLGEDKAFDAAVNWGMFPERQRESLIQNVASGVKTPEDLACFLAS